MMRTRNKSSRHSHAITRNTRQMRRESVHGRSRGSLQSSLMSCLRVVCLSSAIPLLFVLRYILKGGHLLGFSSLEQQEQQEMTGEHNKGGSSQLSCFDFLKDVDFTVEHNLEGSDVVELHHCDLSGLLWSNFTAWAFPLLDETVTVLQRSSPFLEERSERQPEFLKAMQQEFILELLEQYATDQQLCDYSLYRPTVHDHDEEAAQLMHMFPKEDDEVGRLAFIIIAFHDIDHLTSLIDAIHEPHNYILIHLERRCPDSYKQQILQLAEVYSNVVVVQFGTVTYRTDSVSMINLRITRWLTLDLQLEYDYLLLMDGSAFPLVSSHELAQILKPPPDSENKQHVWLGELMHNGQVVDSPADRLLRRKRLMLTVSDYPKLHKRLPMDASSTLEISEPIIASMTRKTTSGNQGIYSHHVVYQLLASDQVMELFALSKYGCCCCLEERNWIAALTLIGFHDQALSETSMFQVWGGETSCKSSMNNAILDRDPSLCYRIEDPGRADKSTAYIWGHDLWEQLADARRRGFLFARKFTSDSEESQRLLADIRGKLWET
jgi:hypothetical protein